VVRSEPSYPAPVVLPRLIRLTVSHDGDAECEVVSMWSVGFNKVFQDGTKLGLDDQLRNNVPVR
jgi:hypothetical protein